MNRVPKIGDIVEIPLPNKGFGYAQYTHKHKLYGALIRVFQVQKKVKDIRSLSKEPINLTVFFPLGPEVSRGSVNLLGNLPISEPLKPFPVFRTGVINQFGEINIWWLWDGDSEQRIGELTPELQDYPIREVLNQEMLIERISCSEVA